MFFESLDAPRAAPVTKTLGTDGSEHHQYVQKLLAPYELRLTKLWNKKNPDESYLMTRDEYVRIANALFDIGSKVMREDRNRSPEVISAEITSLCEAVMPLNRTNEELDKASLSSGSSY